MAAKTWIYLSSSPATLRMKLRELLVNSVKAAATVQLLDRETGEYRVVLQGTLDQEDFKPDR